MSVEKDICVARIINTPGDVSYADVVALLKQPECQLQADEEESVEGEDGALEVNVNVLGNGIAAVVAYFKGPESKSEAATKIAEGTEGGYPNEKVALLWECEEFFPFLLKCLMCKPTCQTYSILCNALWILEKLIMHTSNPSHLGRIDKKHLIQILIYFTNSPSSIVLEQAISALAKATERHIFRCEVLPYSAFIFSYIKHQVLQDKQKNCCRTELLRNLICIVRGILITPPIIRDDILEKFRQYRANHALPENDNEELESFKMETIQAFLSMNQELKVHLATDSMLFEALKALKILLDTGDKTVLPDVLECIFVTHTLCPNTQLFVDTEVCQGVISLFDSSKEELVLSKAAITVTCFGNNPKNLIQFLKAAKSTNDGLKHYWKVLFVLESKAVKRVQLKNAVHEFLNSIVTLFITHNPDIPSLCCVVRLIAESGLLHTICQCVGKQCPADDIRRHAVSLLYVLLSKVPVTLRQSLINSGKIKIRPLVDMINSEWNDDSPAHPSAAKILGYLVDSCVSRRDEALGLSVMPGLLRGLKKWTTVSDGCKTLTQILCTIARIMELKPRPTLEHFKDAPAAFQWLWKYMHVSREKIDHRVAGPLMCLSIIAEYGTAGIDLIFAQAELIPKTIQYLTSKSLCIQGYAMRVIFQICKGTTTHRLAILQEGALKHFQDLLQSASTLIRKMALDCLYGFLLEGILDLEQKSFVKKQLSPLIQVEIDKNDTETHISSRLVHDEITKICLPRNHLC